MSATSAATSDESTTKNVSSSTSSYANIVQKDNSDKDKSNVKSNPAGETAKKSAATNSVAAAINVPSLNTNNKTDKTKVSVTSFVYILII